MADDCCAGWEAVCGGGAALSYAVNRSELLCSVTCARCEALSNFRSRPKQITCQQPST